MMDKIKIMIADDQELIRDSLSIVLGANADMEVTGLAGNGRELIELIEKGRKALPDVVLMDVRMPELSTAIRTVAQGGAMINPGIVTKVVKFFNQMAQSSLTTSPEETMDAAVLGHTERNIALLVGRGLSNKEIAAKLSLSDGTIRNGLSSALSKLNLRDRTQLAIWAVQTGLANEEVHP